MRQLTDIICKKLLTNFTFSVRSYESAEMLLTTFLVNAILELSEMTRIVVKYI